MELLREKGTTLTDEQMNTCLSNVMRDLTVIKEGDDEKALMDMLKSVVQVLIPIKPVTRYSNHPLIIHVLQDTFLELLKQTINEMTETTLNELAKFFQQCLTPTLNTHSESRQALIDGLVFFLAENYRKYGSMWSFSKDTDDDNNNLYPDLLRSLLNYQKEGILFPSLDIVIDCVCSSTFVNTLRSFLSHENELMEQEQLLLINCVRTIYDMNDTEKYIYLVKKMSSRSLRDYVEVMKTYMPLQKPIHTAVLYHFVKMLQFLALDNDVRHQFVNQHGLMIDPLLFTLKSDYLWENRGNTDASGLLEYSCNYLFLLTLESDLLPIIKRKSNTTECMIKLTTAQNSRTQLNAYRTLAIIMNEDELKQLTEPDKIIKIFISYINSAIDIKQHRRLLENILLCLKSLFQHELIRDEFAKCESGISLLIRCATEDTFTSGAVKSRSLELLLVMTFNEQAAIAIQNNTTFLDHIKELSASEDLSLQRVAEKILWKLNNNDSMVASKSEAQNEYKLNDESSEIKRGSEITSISKTCEYDIMISYSHSDKEIVYQIADRLVEDKYRIWLDRDNMYGSSTKAMADAIENSEFVFFCMSDSYKTSGFCELEANYALQRRRCIIPLIVRESYRPDGWLGLITTNKIYIDFSRHKTFDSAYGRIKEEISRYRRQPAKKVTSPAPKNTTPLIHITDEKPTVTDKPPLSIQSLPNELRLWSVDNVQHFLRINEFQAMLPICAQMDGCTLFGLYTMCRINSYGMYESIKMELIQSNSKPLQIASYLKFLEELKKYVPLVPANPNAVSLTCTLM